MKKFIQICAGLRKTNRLRYEVVIGYYRYMQFMTNEEKYYPIELVSFPNQISPYSTLLFQENQ